jgi:hypothetical protein
MRHSLYHVSHALRIDISNRVRNEASLTNLGFIRLACPKSPFAWVFSRAPTCLQLGIKVRVSSCHEICTTVYTWVSVASTSIIGSAQRLISRQCFSAAPTLSYLVPLARDREHLGMNQHTYRALPRTASLAKRLIVEILSANNRPGVQA